MHDSMTRFRHIGVVLCVFFLHEDSSFAHFFRITTARELEQVAPIRNSHQNGEPFRLISATVIIRRAAERRQSPRPSPGRCDQ